MTLRLSTAVDAENPVRHDLLVRDGQLVWIGIDQYDPEDQAEAIGQRVRCRLLLSRGEWYLDQRVGVPWRQTLAARGVSPARMARVFRSALAAVPGVASVVSVAVTRDESTRTASIRFEARGDNGRRIGPLTLDLPYLVRDS